MKKLFVLMIFFHKKLNKDLIFFGENCMADVFCLYKNKFYRYDLELNELENMGEDLNEFSNNILKNYNYYTGYNLHIKWALKNRALLPNEILIPKIPFVLGGEYAEDNLIAIERIKGFSIKIDFQKKISSLQNGEKVKLEDVYILD